MYLVSDQEEFVPFAGIFFLSFDLIAYNWIKSRFDIFILFVLINLKA